MAAKQLAIVIGHLQRLTIGPAFKKFTDAQLLKRFATLSDQAAFTGLMLRHGSMVLSVCRSLLGHEQDAEDAFQAAFLVLARKADAVARHEAVAGWLHRTAFHCAIQVRRARVRRSIHERQARALPKPQQGDETGWRELQAALDEDLAALAAKYRAPFVLCCLEGKSKAEAAQELGWKEGTVSGRLAQARKQLQMRLTHRGMALAAILSALMLTRKALAVVPAALANATTQSVVKLSGQSVGAGAVISAEIAHIVQKVTRTIFVAHCKTFVPVVLVVATVMTGAGALTYRACAVPREPATALSATPINAIEPSKPSTDFVLLQGTWQVIEQTVNGMQVKRHEDSRQFWKIADDNITVDYGDGNIEKMAYGLDQSKTPKLIDLKAADMDDRAMVAAGIYQSNGNELTVCLSSGMPPRRPSTFDYNWDATQNPNWKLLVLRKVNRP